MLLPLRDNAGQPLPRALFDEVRRDMLERFAGLTAYTRAPADGLWEADGHVDHDLVAVYEVMVDELDRPWWHSYGQALAQRFGQQDLVVRASAIERL